MSPEQLIPLLVLSLIVVTVLASLVVAVDLRSHDRSAGRYWTAAFVSACFSAVAFLTTGTTADAWWSVSLGNAAMVAALALVWAGLRAAGDRPAGVAVVVVVVSVVALTAVPPSEWGSKWAGTPEKQGAIVLVTVAGAVEAARMVRRVGWPAATITVVLTIEALYSLVRLVAFVAVGPRDALFLGVLGTATTTVLNLGLTVTAAVALVVWRRRLAEISEPLSGRARALRRALAAEGADRVERLRIDLFERAPSVLGGATARDLDAILRSVAAEHAAASPGGALRWAPAGRGAVLVVPPPALDPEELAAVLSAEFQDRVREAGIEWPLGLVLGPRPEGRQLRAGVSSGMTPEP